MSFLATGSLVAILGAYQPTRSLALASVTTDSASGEVAPLSVDLPARAFGHSGAVRMRFALPGEAVDYPLEVSGDTTALRYAWEPVGDSSPRSAQPRLYDGDALDAPREAGFYRLTLENDGERVVVDGPMLAVLVPFQEKKGPLLDGYRIGTYRGERSRAREYEHPIGFVRVMPEDAELPLSEHLRLGDLLSRDGQESWPRYVAVDPRLLDKLELVVERIARSLGGRAVQVEVDVHSGYRTPAHNRRVPLAARDSRHQYGGAVDVAIDANGDGRIDARDAKLVAAAVDSVEAEYPELIGGMGLYTSRRYLHPYVHIDVRDKRVRWRG